MYMNTAFTRRHLLHMQIASVSFISNHNIYQFNPRIPLCHFIIIIFFKWYHSRKIYTYMYVVYMSLELLLRNFSLYSMTNCNQLNVRTSKLMLWTIKLFNSRDYHSFRLYIFVFIFHISR